MKKALALFLAIMMIVPAVLVPTSAATVSETGMKMNYCCEILVTDFTNKDAYNDITSATDLTVGTLDGYQAVSLTTIDSASSGQSFKIAYVRSKDTAMAASEDISGMTHLAFDLYISDADKLIDQQAIYIELGSAGAPDKYENHFTTTMDQLVSKTLVNGWNHVEIPLSSFTVSGLNDTALDTTAWNFFRFYNKGTFPGGVKMGLANMHFFNAECEEHYSHDVFRFSVLDKVEG